MILINSFSLTKIETLKKLKKEHKTVLPAFFFFKKYIINIQRNLFTILLKIFGINWSTLKKIFFFHFALSSKSKKLNIIFKQFLIIKFLIGYINLIIVEKQAKFFFRKNLVLLLRIKTTRSIRLRLGLPIRGQRTKTNANISKKKHYLSFIYKKKI